MLRLTRLTQGKAYLLIARYRFRVPIPSEGRSFVNQKSNSTQRVSRAWFGVLSVIGLMVAATILGGGAQATANKFVYHVGDAFLASVNPDFAPDFALSTATGDRLQLSGTRP